MGKNSEGAENKKLIIILSVLVGIIAVLVVAILVVHNMTSPKNPPTPEQWDEQYEMESTAFADCEDINNAFSGGAMSEDEAEQTYKDLYNKYENNFYKVRLTLCYTDYMYNKDHNLEKAVARLDKIEPLIEDENDFIDYYDRLIVYYVEADDWDKVRHYASLRDALFPEDEQIVYDDEELVADERDLVDEGQTIEETEGNENEEGENE